MDGSAYHMGAIKATVAPIDAHRVEAATTAESLRNALDAHKASPPVLGELF